MLILLGAILWVSFGVLGVHLARKRWFEIFGDYEGAGWFDVIAICTYMAGFSGFIGSLLYYFSTKE